MRRQWTESLQASTICRITLVFVPGHIGVVGNERADRLAGSAAISEGEPMDRADIVNALIERGRREDLNLNQSNSTTRLRELGLKIGVARKERYNRYMSRLINQNRTGTVSRWTLLEILQRRWEHLWTCPECNEDIPN